MYPRPLLYDLELLAYPDSLDVLSKSMRHLTDMADRLADPHNKRPSTAPSKQQAISETRKPDGAILHQLALQPRFDVRETSDGLIVIGATPGLSKDELSVEVVELGSGKVLEVRGESGKAAAEQPPSAPADFSAPVSSSASQTAPISSPSISMSYERFQHFVVLPGHLDPQTLQARYRDGLLVVTIGRRKDQEPGRLKFAIEG